jgi:hypothetical protein
MLNLLFDILSNNKYSDITQWNSNEISFVISNKNKFTTNILPEISKNKKTTFESFHDYLINKGFVVLCDLPDCIEFLHPYFNKNNECDFSKTTKQHALQFYYLSSIEQSNIVNSLILEINKLKYQHAVMETQLCLIKQKSLNDFKKLNNSQKLLKSKIKNINVINKKYTPILPNHDNDNDNDIDIDIDNDYSISSTPQSSFQTTPTFSYMPTEIRIPNLETTLTSEVPSSNLYMSIEEIDSYLI